MAGTSAAALCQRLGPSPSGTIVAFLQARMASGVAKASHSRVDKAARRFRSRHDWVTCDAIVHDAYHGLELHLNSPSTRHRRPSARSKTQTSIPEYWTVRDVNSPMRAS